MIDFHTHILSGIDDGSRNMEETLEILDKQKEAGVNTIIATPHFYPDQKVEEFIVARKEAYNSIQSYLQEKGMEVKLAAEVLLSVETCNLEGIEVLCIEGTRYILIELPYSHWSDWVYTSVEKLIFAKGLKPILAHVERYDEVYDNPNRLLPFLEMGCILQANASSLQSQSSRSKLTLKLANHGFIHLLGSDVHRSKGLNSVTEGYKILENKVGKSYVLDMQHRGESILEDKKISIENVRPLKKLFKMWY